MAGQHNLTKLNDTISPVDGWHNHPDPSLGNFTPGELALRGELLAGIADAYAVYETTMNVLNTDPFLTEPQPVMTQEAAAQLIESRLTQPVISDLQVSIKMAGHDLHKPGFSVLLIPNGRSVGIMAQDRLARVVQNMVLGDQADPYARPVPHSKMHERDAAFGDVIVAFASHHFNVLGDTAAEQQHYINAYNNIPGLVTKLCPVDDYTASIVMMNLIVRDRHNLETTLHQGDIVKSPDGNDQAKLFFIDRDGSFRRDSRPADFLVPPSRALVVPKSSVVQ